MNGPGRRSHYLVFRARDEEDNTVCVASTLAPLASLLESSTGPQVREGGHNTLHRADIETHRHHILQDSFLPGSSDRPQWPLSSRGHL